MAKQACQVLSVLSVLSGEGERRTKEELPSQATGFAFSTFKLTLIQSNNDACMSPAFLPPFLANPTLVLGVLVQDQRSARHE